MSLNSPQIKSHGYLSLKQIVFLHKANKNLYYFCLYFGKHIPILFPFFVSALASQQGQESSSFQLSVFGVNLNEMLRMLLSWHRPAGRDTHYLSHLTEAFLLHRDPLLNPLKSVCSQPCVCRFVCFLSARNCCARYEVYSLHGSHSSSSATGYGSPVAHIKT